jgi:hypothetical protein
MAGRDDMLFAGAGISKTDKIIELGPSFSPLTPKAEGWRSFVVDQADRGGLVSKYSHDPSVNVVKIEPVDFVWTDGPLSDAVPVEHQATFDVLLACHLLEHIPIWSGCSARRRFSAARTPKWFWYCLTSAPALIFFCPLSTTGEQRQLGGCCSRSNSVRDLSSSRGNRDPVDRTLHARTI